MPRSPLPNIASTMVAVTAAMRNASAIHELLQQGTSRYSDPKRDVAPARQQMHPSSYRVLFPGRLNAVSIYYRLSKR